MNKYLLSLLALGFISASASAAHYGTYTYATKNDMVQGIWGLTPPWNFGAVTFNGYELGSTRQISVCTDTHSRRVPGKLIDGTCYVEWKGKEYGNESFYVLRDEGYTWMELTASNKALIMARGVTNPDGELDEGNHTYHCQIQIYGTTTITLGKYIPSRDVCFFGAGHGRGNDKNISQAKLSILVK